MEAIKGRRSVRKFRPDPIPDEKLRAVLEAAIWAPKVGERWEFVIVKDEAARAKLAKAAKDQKHVKDAPVDVVVCSNLKGAKARERQLYCIQEASAAIQNMLLKAHEEGLGSCWVSEFSEARVSKLLGLPKTVRPLAIIALGYPAEVPEAPKRKDLDKVIHWETYKKAK